MEPEDQILEVTRLERNYDKNLKQKNINRIQKLRDQGFFDKAEGGVAGQLHLNRPGYAEQGFVEGDYPIEVGPLKVKPRASIIESEENVGPDVEKKTGFSNIGADFTVDIGKGIYGKGIYDKGRASEDIYYQGEKVMEDVPLDHDIWKYGIGYGDEGMRAEVIYNPKAERYDFRLVKSFTKGGLAKILGV